jgi:hypothetical protein
MTEYNRMAKGSFTSTGNAQPVFLPFQPDFVEIINYSVAAAAPTANKVPFARWDARMGQGFAVEEVYNSTPVLVADVVTSNGITTFSGGLSAQYGAVFQHTATTDFSISTANPAVITLAGSSTPTWISLGIQTGDVIIFSNLYQTSTTGMPQIAGIPFTITVTGSTTATINWNTSGSNYTAFNTATSTGNIGSFKKVFFSPLYFPGHNVISAISIGATTTTVTTTTQHNYVAGQEIAFHIPSVWGTTQLNSLPNNVIPGSPIYGFVTTVVNSTQFICNISSVGFTAFNPNQPENALLSYPIVCAVGDVNTGGVQYSGGALYPSPQWSYAALRDSSTINGPAIQGAFVNNTGQGFMIGTGGGVTQTSSVLVGSSGNVIYWRAFLHDIQ